VKRKGFSLIELVVVIMILGILAAVAAPRLLNTSKAATDNGLKQTLAVVRDAIEMYTSENGGTLPPSTSAANFRTALDPYLRASFPACTVGPTASNAAQAIDIEFGAATAGIAAPTKGWYFNTTTGDFFVYFNGASQTNPAVTYDQF
jgi:general secretion pathway protein G